MLSARLVHIIRLITWETHQTITYPSPTARLPPYASPRPASTSAFFHHSPARALPPSPSTHDTTPPTRTRTSPPARATAIRPLPPSGLEPNLGRKVYCTHWIKTGECAFMQQGCLYRHDMPDRDTLGRIGFAAVPAWWQMRRVVRSGGDGSFAHVRVHGDAPPSDVSGGGGGGGDAGAGSDAFGRPKRAVGNRQLTGVAKRYHAANRIGHDSSNGHGGPARHNGSHEGNMSRAGHASPFGNDNATAAVPARVLHIKGRASQHSTKHGRIDRHHRLPRWTKAGADQRNGERGERGGRDAGVVMSVPPRPSALARFAAAVKPRFAAATATATTTTTTQTRDTRGQEADLIEL